MPIDDLDMSANLVRIRGDKLQVGGDVWEMPSSLKYQNVNRAFRNSTLILLLWIIG